jgi:hypothetical protein
LSSADTDDEPCPSDLQNGRHQTPLAPLLQNVEGWLNIVSPLYLTELTNF